MRLELKPKWSPIEHMNLARARKPESGGKIYQKARTSANASLAPRDRNSWDDIEYTLQQAKRNFALLAFPGNRIDGDPEQPKFLSPDDMQFINDGGL